MTTNDQDDDDDDEEIPTEINYSCKLQLKNNVLDGKFSIKVFSRFRLELFEEDLNIRIVSTVSVESEERMCMS